jgi:HNH endonuclease
VARDRPRHPLYGRVADRARHRCEYCLAPEDFSSKEFHVEHVAPRVRGGADVLENLALACFRCNLSKAAAQTVPVVDSGRLIRLFNPRTDDWNAHFEFVIAASEELAFIQGTDDIGRATVVRLRMNAPHAARARWRWFLAFALESEFLSD